MVAQPPPDPTNGDAKAVQAPPPLAGDETRRDRLLAALTLIAGMGLMLATPFALQAGAPFFLPLTAALVIAVALVPMLEWLERRRVPSGLAAFLCLVLFLAIANVALASIVVPASGWVRELPARIGRIQANVKPVIDTYAQLEAFVNRLIAEVAAAPARTAQANVGTPPTSLIDLVGTSAPSALIEMFFAILVIYFVLSGWSRLRARAITARRSFDGAMATARVIQNVVDDTSAYLGTITVINLSLGLTVAAALWAIGMPTPLMWGGIVALLNYIPYLGPILAAALLALGGLMTFDDLFWALLPSAIMIGAHLIEANLVTPMIVGHRLTIHPVLILVSLSFWGWVWGLTGALLAVPLLIIIQTVLNAAGKPDIAGFLFERGMLVRPPTAPGSIDRNSVDQDG
ncbi:AI-2E family transporter [Sphingomonas sp. BGYR3]|uniref:AI-2E family transporter n=1 Tax=Sphingomonas sp. BGYR3 TaxID=2975483 RepID=UPI0021A70437|nr:AI-2E family transporter [Sphingomonas sp. BGYR3]MDG5487540.1 AI-2E family transporter [Sphingomonas sp. BGYR3]